MAVNAPLVIVSGEIQQIPAANELGPITGGTTANHAMTQDQFGANSTQMLTTGNPTFAPGITIAGHISLIAHAGYIN